MAANHKLLSVARLLFFGFVLGIFLLDAISEQTQAAGEPAGCQCTNQGMQVIVGFNKDIISTNDKFDAAYAQFKGTLKDPKDSDVVGVMIKIRQIDSLHKVCAPYKAGSDFWDCSKPILGGTDICCCVILEQGSATTKYECSQKSMLESGGACGKDKNGKDQKLFPLPAAGSCDSLESQGEIKVNQEGPGLTADTLLAKASDLNKVSFTSPQQFIGQGVKVLVAFIGSILLMLYVYAGIIWMLSSGNSEQITKAKHIFVWATLGVVVMLASYLILDTIFKLL